MLEATLGVQGRIMFVMGMAISSGEFFGRRVWYVFLPCLRVCLSHSDHLGYCLLAVFIYAAGARV